MQDLPRDAADMNTQEMLWAGPFGDEYTDRNRRGIEADRVLFTDVFAQTEQLPWSVLELGAGDGNNLAAIKAIDPDIETSGVEINMKAYEAMKKVADFAWPNSILGFRQPDRHWDLVFTKGVLIHVAPEDLPTAYDTLYQCAARYIMVAEYYAPKPQAIPYRGVDNALWKRDFAGEILDRFPDLRLITYEFVYHRDPYPQDDLTWFLMEKP